MPETGFRQRYLIHAWADGSAVFDLATGDTHVLDKLMTALLQAHLDGKRGADAVAAVVAESPDAASVQLKAQADAAYRRLVSLDLPDWPAQ